MRTNQTCRVLSLLFVLSGFSLPVQGDWVEAVDIKATCISAGTAIDTREEHEAYAALGGEGIEVVGDVDYTDDTTWTADKTWIVTGVVLVKGGTLTIEPGAKVLLGVGSGIRQVGGSVVATGASFEQLSEEHVLALATAPGTEVDTREEHDAYALLGGEGVEVVGDVDITGDVTWTADKTWIVTGVVLVKDGMLTIEPGTRVLLGVGSGIRQVGGIVVATGATFDQLSEEQVLAFATAPGTEVDTREEHEAYALLGGEGVEVVGDVDITGDVTWTADKTWIVTGVVLVKDGMLTIEPGAKVLLGVGSGIRQVGGSVVTDGVVFTNLGFDGRMDYAEAERDEVRLDTDVGKLRVAAKEEPLAFSTLWGESEAAQVKVLYSTAYDESAEVVSEAGPAEGEYMWQANTPGYYTFSHVTGDETLTATFVVTDSETTETVFEGTIAESTDWTKGKVILVDGVVTVNSGVTLTIAPGAVVKFMDGAGIVCEAGGRCVADGVIFTHVNDDTVGGDTLLDGSTTPLAGKYVLNGVSGNDATEYRYHPDPTVTLSGTIAQNEVWRGFNVYCVTGNVTVANGVTLTVEPGAIIKFNPGLSLTVNSGATLNAIGTRAQPIVFTSIKDDDYGGDTNGDGDETMPSLGDWIKIGINGGVANFDFAHILYSSRNATTGAINMNGGTVVFNNGEIAHGLYDAVGVESGNFYMTNSVIRDCLLAFRHWATDPIVNCVIYDCGRLTQGGGQNFVNCIFSHITETWEAFGFPRNTTYRNCCFWNENGSVLTAEGTQDAMTVCGQDGNIWGNPRFLDPDNGDFRVDEKSPCVDLADAGVAPEFDYFGQPRVNAPDIGICEVMPRNVTSDIDLVPQSVTADAEAVSGQLLTINWTVANQGGADVDAVWRDTVSLVSANGRSVTLGDKVITKRLVAGGTMSCSASFIVPAIAEGAWYPKVNVNSYHDVFEGALVENNAMTATAATRIVAAALEVGAEQETVVQLDVAKDTTFRLANNGEIGSLLVIHADGEISAWLGMGNSVLQANAIRYAVKVAEGLWLMQIPAGDDVYVSLVNSATEAQQVSMIREIGDFFLFDRGRITAANGGSVSLDFAGTGFAEGMVCQLVKGGNVIEASDVNIQSAVSGTATFQVAGASEGDWDLVVMKGNEKSQIPALTLTECRKGPMLTCHIDVASNVRMNRIYTGLFEYGNSGDMSLGAPYVKLTASEGTYIRLTEADAWTDTIELMAISESYPASLLKPGERRQVSFLYKTTKNKYNIAYEYSPVETLEFIKAIANIPVRRVQSASGSAETLAPIASDEIEISGQGIYDVQLVKDVLDGYPRNPLMQNMRKLFDSFPWDTNAEYMRPTWATDEMWSQALAVLKSNLGNTWYSYQQRMRNNADFLMKIGQPTYRLDRLFQLEVNEALGIDRAVQTLAGGTDLARSGRGIGISFSRNYPSAMCHRLTKGRLGYGWIDNYSIWAEMHPVVTWTYEEDNPTPAASSASSVRSKSLRLMANASDGNGSRSILSSYGEWERHESVIDGATVEFHLSGGSSYVFELRDKIWQPQSAFDKTTLKIENAEYVLKFVNGTVFRLNYKTGMPISMCDNQGNEVDYTYDGKKIVKVEHSDGQSLAFTYSGDKVASVTDDQGRVVTYGYTGDMLTSVTAFNGLVTRYVYHAADSTPLSRALTQIVYPDGTTKDYTYDDQGRMATVSVNGNQYTTEIVRGVCGSYSVIAPNGAVTEVTVGASGETLKTVNALGQIVEQKYTTDTQLESVIAPSGKRNKITYNTDGAPVASLSASGATTSFAYEPDFDNLASVTDAKGHSISYGYDDKGRGNSISYVDGSMSSLEYNEKGDVTKATNRRGEMIEYEYDGEGNLVKKTWPNGRTFTLAYDAKGNVTNAADSVTGAVTMEYDANERLTRIVYPKDRGFTYTYDEFGRMTERTMLVGRDDPIAPSAADIQRYTYDSLGRLSTVTDGDDNPYLTNAYDPTTGWLTTQTYGNGTVVSNAYDILGRTIGIYHGRAGTPCPPWLAFFEYTYDSDGKCISQTTAEGVESYTYDADGQLTAVTYPDGTSETFSYDAVGNRIKANNTTYTANSLNQYTSLCDSASLREETLTYDLDGNMTRKGDTHYTYDTLNRLVAVTNEAENIRWSCEYDVFGNRVSVTDNGTTTERLFVQGSLPSVAAEFHGDTLSKSHVLVGAVRLATHNSPTPNSPTLYYHADMLGSARLLTDGTGATKGTRSFKAFGETRVSTGEKTDAGYVGTLGVETDRTGLLFMRNRYYDAGMGRFIQMDPIGLNAGDVNVYRYCGNDGEAKSDLTGFEAHIVSCDDWTVFMDSSCSQSDYALGREGHPTGIDPTNPGIMGSVARGIERFVPFAHSFAKGVHDPLNDTLNRFFGEDWDWAHNVPSMFYAYPAAAGHVVTSLASEAGVNVHNYESFENGRTVQRGYVGIKFSCGF